MEVIVTRLMSWIIVAGINVMESNCGRRSVARESVVRVNVVGVNWGYVIAVHLF